LIFAEGFAAFAADADAYFSSSRFSISFSRFDACIFCFSLRLIAISADAGAYEPIDALYASR